MIFLDKKCFCFKHTESLRERRLAFRRRNTMKTDKPVFNQLPEYVLPTHPVRFQDRQYYNTIKILRLNNSFF
jgi:hypothetical protein